MRMELTSLHGLEVYTTRGKYVGKVDDVVLDPEERRISALAVGSINRDLFDVTGKGVQLPYRWVTAVGDIVIMRQIEPKRAAAKEEEKKKQ